MLLCENVRNWMVSLGKNVTYCILLELREHGTLLLSLGHISSHMVGYNRTHPPQHNKKYHSERSFISNFGSVWILITFMTVNGYAS